MYTIIGGDGKEYGPVPADQIRAWIAAGRANLDSRTKELGSDEWKRLGDFPAFGGTGAQPSIGAPPPVQGTPAEIAAELIARAGKLDISSCYERSWNLLKAHFWPMVGVVVLAYAILLALRIIPILGIAAVVVVGGPLKGGLYAYFLKRARGGAAQVSDAFYGFGPAFLPLVLATLAVALLTIAGLVLLVLPGIYLAVGYMFTYLLMVDRKLGFWEAMEVSRRVITAQWWRLLGLALLAIPFLLLGVLALVVGIFVAVPLILGAFVYAYEDLCNCPRR